MNRDSIDDFIDYNMKKLSLLKEKPKKKFLKRLSGYFKLSNLKITMV